jgi:copper(I)-binding protein
MRSSRRSSPSRPVIVGLVLAAGMLVAACASSGPSAGPMSAHDAWIRAPMAGGVTAGYLVIENGTGQADALTGVTIPAGGMVTLHQTTTDASGQTAMSPVDAIHVPAGGTVSLAPGSFHLMIDGLSGEAGDMVELQLTFEHAGTISVQAEVRAG